MKRIVNFLAVILATAVLSRGAELSSQNYTVTATSIDGGGGHGSSASYGHDLMVVQIAGHSVAPVVYAMDLGFGSLLNNAPIAFNDVRSHPRNAGVDIPAAALFGNDEDPDGDDLVLFAVDGTSTNGALLTVSGGTIRYSPPVGVNAVDRFNYTVQDVNGDTSSATVTMVVAPPVADQELNTVAVFQQDDGTILVRLRQAPGKEEYFIEFTHDLSEGAVWEPLLTAHAKADGIVELLIDPADAEQTYFRALVF